MSAKADPILDKLDALVTKGEQIAGWAGALALALLLAITLLEVILRNIFESPILGLVDMVEWFLPIVALAGVGAAQRLGEHFRMELAIDAMRPRLRWVTEMLTTLAALFFASVVAIYAVRATIRAWSVGYISADIEWPLWPPKLAIALIFLLLAMRLALQAIALGRQALDLKSTPPGMPENLTQQALARRGQND